MPKGLNKRQGWGLKKRLPPLGAGVLIIAMSQTIYIVSEHSGQTES